MPKLQRKELTFQTGEISPRYYGRSDTEVYDKGLAVAENVFIDKRGGAFKRAGLVHVGRFAGNDARVFTMQISRQTFYTLLIRYDQGEAQGKLVVLAPGASFLDTNLLLNGNFNDAGANWIVDVEPDPESRVEFETGEAALIPLQNNPQLIAEPGFTQDGVGWNIRQSHILSTVTFPDNTCLLQPRQVGPDFAGIWQEITTPSPNTSHVMRIVGNLGINQVHVMVGIAEADGTFLDTIVSGQGDPNEGGAIVLTFTPTQAAVFVTIDCEFPPSVFAVLDEVTVVATIEKHSAIQQEATVVAAITDLHIVNVGQQTNELIEVKIGTTQGGEEIASISSTNLQIVLEFVPNNATYWVTVLADGAVTPEARISFVGTAAEVPGSEFGFEMDAPWTEAQLDEIHAVPSPSGDTVYFTHPNVPPYQLVYNFETNTFIPLALSVFTSPPAAWVGENQPSTGAHFQGRLWFGGAPFDGRQTVWASVSGSPLDFTVTADSDSSSLEFALQEFGRIEWMLGTKNMLIGAENGEHIISSDGPVITNTDFQIEQQSSFGSNNMQGAQIGEKVFYATPDGRQLRAMGYQWQENNWLSQDLTYISEHLTVSPIVRSCWAQHPNALFLCVLKDGSMLVLTYDRTAETVAWARLNISGMDIHDVATARRDGHNQVVVVGTRDEFPGTIDIETTAEDLEYLDSYVSVFHETPNTLITGLDHLEGLTVRALVDGAVDPLQTVIGGQINTSVAGFQLHAGTPYNTKIVTLPPDVPQEQIRSWKKRWNKVWALMLQSNSPIINGTRPPDRTPSTPMDTVEPVKTGHFKTVNLGWDDNGQITIEEDLPVAMNVLAIYGEMGAETL